MGSPPASKPEVLGTNPLKQPMTDGSEHLILSSLEKVERGIERGGGHVEGNRYIEMTDIKS